MNIALGKESYSKITLFTKFPKRDQAIILLSVDDIRLKDYTYILATGMTEKLSIEV